MRKIVFILMCSLVFAACSSEHCRNTRLLQAETLCQQYPDSTIRLLDGLDIDSFSVEADRALYGLVFTEAIHRVGLILSSDTLTSGTRLPASRYRALRTKALWRSLPSVETS